MCHHPKRFSEDCVDFNMHEEKELNKQQPEENISKSFKEGDIIMEFKVGMHGEPIEIVLDKYAQRARGIFPGDELMVILRKK